MRGTVPILQCDADDGLCGTWDVDHYLTDASSVNGVRVSIMQRSPGWTNTEDADYCPEHAAGGAS